VRTAPVFWSGKRPSRKRRKTGAVVFSGLFFFGDFLLEGQKKVTIKKQGFPVQKPGCFTDKLCCN